MMTKSKIERQDIKTKTNKKTQQREREREREREMERRISSIWFNGEF